MDLTNYIEVAHNFYPLNLTSKASNIQRLRQIFEEKVKNTKFICQFNKEYLSYDGLNYICFYSNLYVIDKVAFLYCIETFDNDLFIIVRRFEKANKVLRIFGSLMKNALSGNRTIQKDLKLFGHIGKLATNIAGVSSSSPLPELSKMLADSYFDAMNQSLLNAMKECNL
jgi:hypothetical protein